MSWCFMINAKPLKALTICFKTRFSLMQFFPKSIYLVEYIDFIQLLLQQCNVFARRQKQ